MEPRRLRSTTVSSLVSEGQRPREPGDLQQASPSGQGAQGAHSHDVSGRSPAHEGEGLGQRALGVELVVRHHQGESGRHAKVGEEADEQRGHDADGDGLHGVLGFFTWRRRRSRNQSLG